MIKFEKLDSLLGYMLIDESNRTLYVDVDSMPHLSQALRRSISGRSRKERRNYAGTILVENSNDNVTIRDTDKYAHWSVFVSMNNTTAEELADLIDRFMD